MAAVIRLEDVHKTYYTGGFSLAASLGVSSAAVGQPQMYGFEVTYKF